MAQSRSNKKNQILQHIINGTVPEEAFEPDTEEEALLEKLANKAKDGGFGGGSVSEEALAEYQKKTDNNLTTTSKTIVGAINEVKQTASTGVDAETVTAAVQEKVQQLVASGDLEVQPVANNSVDLGKLSQDAFGNTYVVDANAAWVYACFYLDTSAIPAAEQYEYHVSLELSYDPETQCKVRNIGMASTTDNDGTIFNFTTEELANKDRKYFLNLNGVNTTLCTNLKLTSNGGIFKTTIENIRVSINGANVPIIKCEARSQNSNVGTVTYTPAEKGFVASIEDIKAVNDNINNIKVDRYSFSEDLLSSEEDNCINTTSIRDTFFVGFDFGEEVTNPEEIEFQFCYAEDNTFPIERISYFPMLRSPSFMGENTDFSIPADMKDNPNQIHKLTAKPKGTGRYWGVYIWGNTSGLTHFRVIKAKYNGRYLKCITGRTQLFDDNRIMNYGIYRNEENKKTKYKGKTIIGFGDSTTFGDNGASMGKGIMYHIGRNFPQCKIVNKGANGQPSSHLISAAKSITDYRNAIAATICYGWNDGGASGSTATSIPQLTCKGLKDVITTGITVNDTLIDTEDKYFALFGNNWYGNMAKGIEYLNFYNPMMQLYLHSPHSSDTWGNHQTMCEAITTAMKDLASYYSIPFIDTHGEIGINNRNSHLYRLDWAHLGDLGNEIKGNFLANQIESKLMVYPFDDEEYAVKSLTMNRETETVAVGSSIYLYVKVAPYNATNKNVVWTTDNENVTVESDTIGLEWQKVIVTGVTAGETVVTATSEDGEFTATCTVTVTE